MRGLRHGFSSRRFARHEMNASNVRILKPLPHDKKMHTATTNTPKAATACEVALPIKGTTTIAAIAEAMGARPDGHSYSFNLSVEIVGESIEAKAAAVTSNVDKENALAQLSSAERKAVAKWQDFCKASAAARVDGQTVIKTVWNGIARG